MDMISWLGRIMALFLCLTFGGGGGGWMRRVSLRCGEVRVSPFLFKLLPQTLLLARVHLLQSELFPLAGPGKVCRCGK